MMGFYGFSCRLGNGMTAGILGLLMMLVIAAAVIISIYVIARNRRTPLGVVPIDNRSEAEIILDERYARGEINSEEYQIIKAHLRR